MICQICHKEMSGRAGKLTCSARCRNKKKRNSIAKDTTFDVLYALDREAQVQWVLAYFEKELIDEVVKLKIEAAKKEQEGKPKGLHINLPSLDEPQQRTPDGGQGEFYDDYSQ